MDDLLERYKWSIAFWAVQLIGWGGITYIGYLFTPNLEGFKQTSFFLFSLWAGLAIGLTCTGLLRAYLKRNILLDRFDSKQLWKILAAIVVGGLVYGGLSYGSGFLIRFADLEKDKVPDIYKEFGIGYILFNSFIIVTVWTLLYMSVKAVFKLNADRLERAELNATLRQAQLNTLKGQINPHFMFNSLNNIRGLMLEDVDKSREMLTKLSEMLRYSLTKSDSNAIALEEELEMVDHYIALSKIQLENRLEYRKEVDADTLSISIPPMIIQLLIENATKHGISNLKEGGMIVLKARKVGAELCITVTNTGKLQIAKDSTRLGLKNIRQRLRLLYGDRATFSLGGGGGRSSYEC